MLLFVDHCESVRSLMSQKSIFWWFGKILAVTINVFESIDIVDTQSLWSVSDDITLSKSAKIKPMKGLAPYHIFDDTPTRLLGYLLSMRGMQHKHL